MDETGDAFNAAVAAELRAQRARVQRTVDAIVKETKISKSAVLNYLNNKRDIPVPALYALCQALGISPVEIMNLAERSIAEDGLWQREGYDLVANGTIHEATAGDDADFDHA